jgi:hypothetical protein
VLVFGLGGQLAEVLPDLDLVVVLTSEVTPVQRCVWRALRRLGGTATRFFLP